MWSHISVPDGARVHIDSVWFLSSPQDNYTFAQPGIQRKVKALEELVSRIDGESSALLPFIHPTLPSSLHPSIKFFLLTMHPFWLDFHLLLYASLLPGCFITGLFPVFYRKDVNALNGSRSAKSFCVFLKFNLISNSEVIRRKSQTAFGYRGKLCSTGD